MIIWLYDYIIILLYYYMIIWLYDYMIHRLHDVERFFMDIAEQQVFPPRAPYQS